MGRISTILAIAALAGAMAIGCAPQNNAVNDPFNSPLRENYVQLVSVSDGLVEVDSAGRKVRVRAPDGLCISKQSIQTFRESVFMVVDGCDGAASPLSSVVSINVANGPLAADLASMEAHFRTIEGQVGLGYGGDEEDVSLIGLRRSDNALYAMVADMSEFGPAFAGDEICRVFTELNGRMVVVTMISRRELGQSADALRAEAAEVVRALRKANA